MKKSEAKAINDTCKLMKEKIDEIDDKLNIVIKRTDKVIARKEPTGFRPIK